MATGRTLHVAAGATDGDGSTERPFGSIQDAIDRAGPGDLIQVGDGTYTENLVFRNSGTVSEPIQLRSQNGADQVVILPLEETADTIRVSGADHIVIDGLTVQGPSDDTRQAVQIHGKNAGTDPASFVTLSNSVILRGGGDGIKGSKAENITLTDNLVTGGTAKEAAIDFVGVTGAVISGNTIAEVPGIGVMLKGGSADIVVSDNVLVDIGKNALEVGGYTPLKHYPPGFIDAGNQFEARNVAVSGNSFDGIANTAIRIIAGQQVEISANIVRDAAKIVTVDDSAKFHDPWFAEDLVFLSNDFGPEGWLIDRSAAADIVVDAPDPKSLVPVVALDRPFGQDLAPPAAATSIAPDPAKAEILTVDRAGDDFVFPAIGTAGAPPVILVEMAADLASTAAAAGLSGADAFVFDWDILA